MQLDRTEIVVRARSALELFDLSLQVLKRHIVPIALTSGLLGIPLLVLDGWAIAWMLDEDALLAAEQLDYPQSAMRWRHSWHLIVLFGMQFPLISLPTTVFLGNQIFFEPMPLRKLIGRLRPIAPRSLWVLGIWRLGMLGLLAELFVNRDVVFDGVIEGWLIFTAGFFAIGMRAVWPFAPEILGLELCPLVTRGGSGEVAYRTRSRSLHRYLLSENIARFVSAVFFGTLMFVALIGAQLFLIGASTGVWYWNAWFDYIGLPLSMWLVGLYLATFRFLSYLDSRIRLEGWEIELRLKAEAARLSQTAPSVSEAKAKVVGDRSEVAGLNSAIPRLTPAGPEASR